LFEQAIDSNVEENMTKTFHNYFDDIEQYPTIGMDILPMNVLYEYVSSSFLNGFINYTTIIKAFVLGRYHDWDEVLDEGEGDISVRVPPNTLTWKTIHCKTKNELYKELTIPGAMYHGKLDVDFQDDVLILSKSKVNESGEWCYFYFWYDRDCSDCSIGRFKTKDTETEVIEKFSTQCQKKYEYNEFGSKEIPLHYFAGWVKG